MLIGGMKKKWRRKERAAEEDHVPAKRKHTDEKNEARNLFKNSHRWLRFLPSMRLM